VSVVRAPSANSSKRNKLSAELPKKIADFIFYHKVT
jgi:hypothetical protein